MRRGSGQGDIKGEAITRRRKGPQQREAIANRGELPQQGEAITSRGKGLNKERLSQVGGKASTRGGYHK